MYAMKRNKLNDFESLFYFIQKSEKCRIEIAKENLLKFGIQKNRISHKEIDAAKKNV